MWGGCKGLEKVNLTLMRVLKRCKFQLSYLSHYVFQSLYPVVLRAFHVLRLFGIIAAMTFLTQLQLLASHHPSSLLSIILASLQEYDLLKAQNSHTQEKDPI